MNQVRLTKMAPISVICALAMVLASCQTSKPEAEAPKAATTVELAAGTPISLVLLKVLESGVDDEGSDVPLLVKEDVKDAQGHILIAKGTPAQGRVTWSRREEMLGGLTNRPARLKFDLMATVSVDGQPIDLCADIKKPEEPYELNRSNTGQRPSIRQLEATLQDPRDQAVVRAMNDLFEGKDAVLLEEQESRERLARIGRDLNLPSLSSLAQQGEVGKVRPLLDHLRRGGPINEVANHLQSSMPALSAVMEWTGVAGQISDRLEGLGHGRNIKAYVGTPIEGFVEKPATVRVDK